MYRFKSRQLLNTKFLALAAATIIIFVCAYPPTQSSKPCECPDASNVQKQNSNEQDEPSVTKNIDLFYNIRKLTLFAVHELNAQIAKTGACADLQGKTCPKWWANPLNAVVIKTYSYSDHFEHALTFIAEPGSISYFARVRQNHIPPIGTDWTELEIQGNFIRLDDRTHALSIPLLDLSYNATDNEIEEEPELISWPRNASFMVGDYVDFKDPGLYLISPGGLREKAQTLYCGDALKMLVIVTSKPDHFDHRQAIRKSYGSNEYLKKLKVRVVFQLGIGPDSLQPRIIDEAGKHDDIIQSNIVDSYHNLTLKHLSHYNWVQRTCEEVGLPKFVLKADDDFLLNIELALRVAYHNRNYDGTSFCHTDIIRDVSLMAKWYTPRYIHKVDRYPGYLSGVTYLVRTDIFPRMLKISLTTPMIHIDDVYVTGMLPRQLKIYPVGSSLFTYGRLDPCSLKKMVCSNTFSPNDMLDMWREFTSPVIGSCNLTDLDSFLPIQTPDDAFRSTCNYV